MARKKANSPPIVIRRARMSFLWAEILPDFLEQQVPDSAPFAFLIHRGTFSLKFQEVLNGFPTQPRLEVPWLQDQRQQFWMRYLVQGILGDVSGSQAWKYLIPLRVPDIGIRLGAEGFDGTIFIDAFYYPFGTAAAVTLRWEADSLLPDFVEKSWALSQTGKFLIQGQANKFSLNALGERILTTLRKNVLGKKALGGYQSPKPFSVVTIIEAFGPDPMTEIKGNTEVLRALEVLSNWPADRTYFKLPDPEKVCLHLKQSAPPGSALYAEERGRAVWHPAMFRMQRDQTASEAVDQIQRSSKLGCYHRNLFFASLQTESLGRLISYTAQQFAAGKEKVDLTESHRQLAENAALCLTKLYLGDKGNTWRSASMARQIDQTFRKDFDAVLAQFPVARLP